MEQFVTLGIRKSIDIDARTVTAWASKAVLDRDNEIILGSAWMHPDSTANFERNPIVLIGHDYQSLPVAKVTNLDKLPEGLKFTAKYARTPSAEEAFGIVRDLGLASYSVGFLPKTYRDLSLDEVKRLGFDVKAATKDRIRVYDKCELLEISHVAVPSCPLATALGAAYVGGAVKSKALNDALGKWGAEVSKIQKSREKEASEGLKPFNLGPILQAFLGERLAKMGPRWDRPLFLKESIRLLTQLYKDHPWDVSADPRLWTRDLKKVVDSLIRKAIAKRLGGVR